MDEFNNENQGLTNDETSGISSSEAMNAVEGVSGMTSSEAFNAVEGNAVQGGNVTTEEGAAEAESGFAPYGDQTINNTSDFGQYTAPVVEGESTGESKTLAIVSMVCGIAGLVFSFICGCCGFGWLGTIVGIAGVIIGVMCKMKNLPGQGMAIAGIITGGISILSGLGSIIMFAIGVIGSSQ